MCVQNESVVSLVKSCQNGIARSTDVSQFSLEFELLGKE